MSDEESSSESELDFETRPDLMRSADVGWIQDDNQWSEEHSFESCVDSDEQIMPDLIPENENEEDEERDCWICFVRESENPKALWVTPCKCSGTMGNVHQECIKRWVEEKQGDNFNEEVICPQCNTKYKFAFPEKRLLLQLLTMSNVTTKFGVQILTIGGFIGFVYMGCTFYTRNVLRVMFSTDNNSLLFKTGECLTLEPYFDGVVIPTIRNFMDETGTRTIVQLMVSSALGIPITTDNRIVVNSVYRQLVLKGLRVSMSFMLPIHLIRLRAFPWDEWILKKIDQFERVEMKQAHKESSNSGGIRAVIGGLAMPFMANIVGKILYPSYSPLKRWSLGCCTYLTVKGGLTLLRKYKLRRWNRARQVKDFEEVDQEDDADSQPQREISVEWGGENIFDFRW